MNATLALIVDNCSDRLSHDAELLLSCQQVFVTSSDCSKALQINSIQTRSGIELVEFLETVEADFVGFISSTELKSISHAPLLPVPTHPFLATWLLSVTLPIETATIAPMPSNAWIASTELARHALKYLPSDRWTYQR
jgi:hypothetical protein